MTAATKLKDASFLEENYDKLRQCIKKQRHHFASKDSYCQSYGFSRSHLWVLDLEHKVEHQRTDAFKVWCRRRLLRVHWTARRSNQSFLKEINPEYVLEGLMLKLKLRYFGHLIQFGSVQLLSCVRLFATP